VITAEKKKKINAMTLFNRADCLIIIKQPSLLFVFDISELLRNVLKKNANS